MFNGIFTFASNPTALEYRSLIVFTDKNKLCSYRVAEFAWQWYYKEGIGLYIYLLVIY